MMKRKILLFIILICMMVFISSCGKKNQPPVDFDGNGNVTDLGDDDTAFGGSNDDLYDGYFEDDKQELTINCVSGSTDCYSIDGSVVTFTNLSEDSIYSISGQLKGNIIIDVGDEYKLELELQGLSVVSESTNPITILSGDKITLVAKKNYENYLYDDREIIDETDETVISAAIYSIVDLDIQGKGKLVVVSKNNKGIHTKDDLNIKNLDLSVLCTDNALKGNDSVSIVGGNITLIATQGDGIKTSNSDISSKGNQKGTISIAACSLNIYAACDGIDSAYNVVIEDETTVLNIYTDKYSNYSEEVIDTSEELLYIRFNSKNYNYSVKYYNDDEDYLWENAQFYKTVNSEMQTYYYYALPKHNKYAKIVVFIYSLTQEQGQDTDYLVCTDYLSFNTNYDTFAITQRGNTLNYNWTNYNTQIGGGMGGGMNDGNSDKGDHSTKGIKAANEVNIYNGTIYIKTYDDAIHANNGVTLENGVNALGNININGGKISIYSNDDGIHADGVLTISDGIIDITKSYEGLEGLQVIINNGDISIVSSDDGINSTATSGQGIVIGGGNLYILAGGDGLDSNSRTAYSGIVFKGGKTVVISTSGGNSAIDTEAGYTYTSGSVLAIMPNGGMTSEATHCSNFSSVAKKISMSLSSGKTLTVSVSNSAILSVKIPCNLSAIVIYLGSTSANISLN